MDRLSPQNNDVIKRGKTISTLIRELGSADPDIKVGALIEGQLLKAVSSTAFEDNFLKLKLQEIDNSSLALTVRELLMEFIKIKDWGLEVKLELGYELYSIGLVGKQEGYMVLFHFNAD